MTDTYQTPTMSRDSFVAPIADRETIDAAELSPREVQQMIANRLDLDMRNSSDLGSYNFDYMDPECDELRERVRGKVFIDKETYVQTAALGDSVVDIIQQMYGGVAITDAELAEGKLTGTVTIGSSEAIMLGLIAHRQNWYNQWVINMANGTWAEYGRDRPFLMYARDVHTCWDKFSLYYNVPALVMNLEDGQYLLDPATMSLYLNMSLWDLYTHGSADSEQMWTAIDKEMALTPSVSEQETYMRQKYVKDLVCCVGAVLGTTFTGQGDDISGINTALIQATVTNNYEIPIHVDAACGGFIVQYTAPTQVWGFLLGRVKSINVSNHKFGATYPGCGTVVFKNADVVDTELIWNITYLGGGFTDYTVNFSRDSAGPISSYYNLKRFGIAGYQKQAEQCVANAAYLNSALVDITTNYTDDSGTPAVANPFNVISDNAVYPVVVWEMSAPSNVTWTLTQLADAIQEQGWKLPAYRLPLTSSRNPDGQYVCRVVTRPDVSRQKIDLLLSDIEAAITSLETYQPTATPTREGSGDYT